MAKNKKIDERIAKVFSFLFQTTIYSEIIEDLSIIYPNEDAVYINELAEQIVFLKKEREKARFERLDVECKLMNQYIKNQKEELKNLEKRYEILKKQNKELEDK